VLLAVQVVVAVAAVALHPDQAALELQVKDQRAATE
jgi:hypothetical protein